MQHGENEMNERIKKLAEQAREYANSKEPYEKIKNKAWIDVYDEKFAELIIRECVQVLEEDDGATPNGELLMEHFGIE
jgi:hypothetical protein